jgi:hypothetical protein
MEKIIKVDKRIQFCDICENEVDELQITDKYDKHICFKCYDYRLIVMATSNPYYDNKGRYKFDINKINELVLDEMKRQVKKGLAKYD